MTLELNTEQATAMELWGAVGVSLPAWLDSACQQKIGRRTELPRKLPRGFKVPDQAIICQVKSLKHREKMVDALGLEPRTR